ncbi:hypothetical protein JCM16814_07610 [Desulfobaculum senezii]|jgi:TolB-like protein
MTVRTITLFCAALAASLMLCSCAADFDLSGPGTVYINEYVDVSDVQTMVHPQNHPMQKLTAVVLPLRIHQRVDDHRYLSRELTRTLLQKWQQNEVFPVLTFAPDAKWTTAANAMPIARAAHADLIVAGDITHVMFGGTQGETNLAVRVEIYDASTGSLIWSMAQAGQMSPGRTKDFIFFTQQSRMPMEPIQAIMSTIATDIGAPVADWNQPVQDPGADSAL